MQGLCNGCATVVQRLCNGCATVMQWLCNVYAMVVQRCKGVVRTSQDWAKSTQPRRDGSLATSGEGDGRADSRNRSRRRESALTSSPLSPFAPVQSQTCEPTGGNGDNGEGKQELKGGRGGEGDGAMIPMCQPRATPWVHQPKTPSALKARFILRPTNRQPEAYRKRLT